MARKDIPLEPITEGMISEDVVSHYTAPANSLSWIENFHNDNLGVLTPRRELKKRFEYMTNGAYSCILMPTNTEIKLIWNESGNYKISTLSGEAPFVVNNFMNSYDKFDNAGFGYVIMTRNGYQPHYTTGTNSNPSSLGTNFPADVNLISFGFAGRIWTAKEKSNKVYYSDVIPATGVQDTTGGTEFLTINTTAGDGITGLVRTQQCLYVFTRNSIFRIFNTQAQDTTPFATVGASCQEAIIRAKDGIYFYHSSGIYRMADGGSPQEISQRVRDVVAARYQWQSPFEESFRVISWMDNDHVYFSMGWSLLGERFGGNKSFTLRYTISTQVWCVYSFYSFIPHSATTLQSPTTTASYQETINPVTVLMGVETTTPNIYLGALFDGSNKGSPDLYSGKDLGKYDILLDAETHWKTFGAENHSKSIGGVSQANEKMAGLNVLYKTDNGDWQPGITLTDKYITLDKDLVINNFNRIKFKYSGNSNGSSGKVGQTTILSVEDNGYNT